MKIWQIWGSSRKKAELDEEQQEKEPMTGLKMEDEEVKFTGLSKEELLRVAGTPGWVRTRWTLLVLFWLSWLLMLVGSVLIILKAPPCRDLPDSHWWNHGPLYRLRDVRVFSVERRMDYLKQLNVKGLLIGPIHEAPPNNALSLRFEQISSDLGTMNQFKSLISTAHKKGISVVLDLTPNYQGSTGPWFSNDSITIVAEKLKSALVFWMDQGVEGFLFSGTDLVSNSVPSLWTDIRNIIQNGTESRPGRRSETVCFSSVDHVSSLLSSSGVDLLLSPLLSSGSGGFAGPAEVLDSVQTLCASHSQLNLAWSLGGAEVHLASAVGPALVRLYQLLLLTLPGTPVFNYGDEVGLMDQVEWAERRSSLSFFRSVATLRVKERPLLFGDFLPLSNSSSLLSYVRVWDRGARYLVAFNWGSEEAELVQAGRAELPQQAEVVASTDTSLSDGEVELGALRIGPQQATLLRFNIK
uniref:4F2 cell-surface antigen heavy chain-like n=1 Tax=Gouania willdenowi TaxID=441366 RepID=A0A8C5HVM9_GOUWI